MSIAVVIYEDTSTGEDCDALASRENICLLRGMERD